jgi:hypothetical protein
MATPSEINRPIKILMGTAMIVEIKPVTAAAIPAMCPTGSIWLVNFQRKPILKNCKNNNKKQEHLISSVIK